MVNITPAVPDPPEIENRLWAGFSPASLAFDVGANCGQTIPRLLCFCNFVVAFEPSVEAFGYLTEHFGNTERVALSEFAVTADVGVVELMAIPGKIETGQLVTAGIPGMEWSGDLDRGVVRAVPGTTLDLYTEAFGAYPDFIKIDVEGHEWDVLAGAREVLASGPEMLIEIHSEELGRDIYDLLKKDFEVQLVRHPHYQRESTLWLNHFWFRCFPRPVRIPG